MKLEAPNITPGPWTRRGEYIGSADFHEWVAKKGHLGGKYSICHMNNDHPRLEGRMHKAQSEINQTAVLALPQCLAALEAPDLDTAHDALSEALNRTPGTMAEEDEMLNLIRDRAIAMCAALNRHHENRRQALLAAGWKEES